MHRDLLPAMRLMRSWTLGSASLAIVAWLVVFGLRPVFGSSLNEVAWLATLPLLACVVSAVVYFGAVYLVSPQRAEARARRASMRPRKRARR